MTTTARPTREAWLEAAIEAFRPRFIEYGYPLPTLVHISVGFAYGAKRESPGIAGQAWKRDASSDGINHVFISPEIGDTVEVLATLVHELVHVALDLEDGHRGRFAEIATRAGLEGPMLATRPSLDLATEMMTLSAVLGEYPHGELDVSRVAVKPGVPVPVGPDGGPIRWSTGPRPQTNRWFSIKCPADGYIAKTSRRWLEQGAPLCGICGTRMEPY